MQEDGSEPNDNGEEEAAVVAGARRMLRLKLGTAGLLDPNRIRSPENNDLETRIRADAQVRLEKAMATLRDNSASAQAAQDRQDSALNENFDESLLFSTTGTWLVELSIDASHPSASGQLKTDWETTGLWLGIQGPITADQYEQFYAGWVTYVRLGEAPSKNLRKSFAYFSKVLTHPGTTLTYEMKGVYARLMATDNQIAEEEFRRTMEPLFNALADENKSKHLISFSPVLATGLAGLTSFWLGFSGQLFLTAIVPLVLFAAYLTFFGPKTEEVQGSPNRLLMTVFALVLSSGVCAVGFLAGALLGKMCGQ